MLQGFLGKKVGMSQVFLENGRVVPVTVIQAGPCFVTQVKTVETDGYEAVQIGFGADKRANKPTRGHMKDTQVCRYLREVQVDDIGDYQVGDSVSVEIFTPGEKVDIIARSKGKGFAGVIKRRGFDGGPRTHGQSDRARAPGSIGGGTTPGKVYKGLKMAGHMGNRRITAKGLEIIKVDTDRNLLMVKGGIPGSQMGVVQIRRTGKSVKAPA